jgi:hypothetical protein
MLNAILQLERWPALLAAVLLILTSCANQLEPAQKAIADIEAAVAAAGADAQRYIPDELGAVNAELARLKTRFDQKDYAGVVAAAPAVLAKAQGLAAARQTAEAAEQTALQADWDALAASVPAAVAAVESRVSILSKSAKLPKDLDAAAFESAKNGLADAKTLWDQATAAQAAGSLHEAVPAARQAQEKVDGALASLGMTG